MRAFYYGVAYLKLARVSRCSGEITAKPVKSAATIVERQPYFGSARGPSCGMSQVDGWLNRIKDIARDYAQMPNTHF